MSDEEGLTGLEQIFQGIRDDMVAHRTQVEAGAKAFQERRITLILQTVDARLAEARQKWSEMTPGQYDSLGIASLEAELVSARAQLEADLAAADGEAAIQQALERFRTRWQEAARIAEENRMTVLDLCETLLPKLETLEEKLVQLLDTLEDNHPGSQEVQTAYQALLEDVRAIMNSCDEADSDTPVSDLVPALQNLRTAVEHAKQLLEAFRSSSERPAPEETP
ncbi:hypothetical protein ACFLW0_04495 [Chloroflexota bacterium]